MIIEKSEYPGEAYYVTQSEPETEQSLARIHKTILSLYLSGTPIFTRENIRDLAQQLQGLKGKSGKVFVRGLDGTLIDFAVETGRILPCGPDTEYILGSPFIRYNSIQSLTSISEMSVVRIAHCSLHVYHYMTLRNSTTKNILDIEYARSVGDVENIFKFNQQRWEQSEQCAKIKSILKSVNFSTRIQKIVAFACGSLNYDFKQDTPRSSFQHALVLTLRNILIERQEDLKGHSCFAQDPAYREADRLVLGASGFTVLDDPEGFLEVTDSTVVVSCAAQVPIKQIVTDIARPAAMIWDRAKKRDPSLSITMADPDSPRVTDMILNFYDVFELGGEEEHFGDIVLYVRRERDSSTT